MAVDTTPATPATPATSPLRFVGRCPDVVEVELAAAVADAVARADVDARGAATTTGRWGRQDTPVAEVALSVIDRFADQPTRTVVAMSSLRHVAEVLCAGQLHGHSTVALEARPVVTITTCPAPL